MATAIATWWPHDGVATAQVRGARSQRLDDAECTIFVRVARTAAPGTREWREGSGHAKTSARRAWVRCATQCRRRSSSVIVNAQVDHLHAACPWRAGVAVLRQQRVLFRHRHSTAALGVVGTGGGVREAVRVVRSHVAHGSVREDVDEMLVRGGHLQRPSEKLAHLERAQRRRSSGHRAHELSAQQTQLDVAARVEALQLRGAAHPHWHLNARLTQRTQQRHA
eukprot:ctg_278.g104